MSDDIVYKGRFIWNKNKAESNARKHPGITFEKGSEAYDDPLAIDEYDEENSEYEDRYNRTGIAGDTYLTVSFTIRNNLTRIFSVREKPITKKEGLMMNTSEDTLTKDEIITESGRVFRPAHKELLESLPPDIVQELARRRMKDIERIKEISQTGNFRQCHADRLTPKAARGSLLYSESNQPFTK